MSDATAEELNTRIQHMQADVMLKLMDILKRDQDIRLAPFTLLLTGIGTGRRALRRRHRAA